VEIGLVPRDGVALWSAGSSTHAMPWNHFSAVAAGGVQFGPQRARGDVLDEHLVGGVTMNASTVAAGMAAEWPQCLVSTSLRAVPNEALMRVSITSTE
jgi:hypothetical protein